MKEALIKKLFGAVIRDLKESKDMVRQSFKREAADAATRSRIPYIDEALALFNERVAIYPDTMPQETPFEIWQSTNVEIFNLARQIRYELAEKYKGQSEEFILCKECLEELKALGDPSARSTYENAATLADQALVIWDRMWNAKARCDLLGIDASSLANHFIERAYLLGETPNHPVYSLQPAIPYILAPEVQTPSKKWEMGPEPKDLEWEIYDIEA